MLKSENELVKDTGLSRYTVHKVFKALEVRPGSSWHPAKLDEDVFRQKLEEMNISFAQVRRKQRPSLTSIIFDFLTEKIQKEYGAMQFFFEETGFDRSRWYSLGRGAGRFLEENEEKIFRELLNVPRQDVPND